MTSQAARRAAGSKPVVGSSRKISSGSPISASATSSRRRWPPESLPPAVGLLGRARPARSSRRRRAARCSSRRSSPGTRATVSPARGATPAGRCRSASRHARGARAGSTPSTSTCRRRAARKPSRISTVVVLPAPFGPSRAKISPRRTSRSMPRTASTVPVGPAADLAGACTAGIAWVGEGLEHGSHAAPARPSVIGARDEPASTPG